MKNFILLGATGSIGSQTLDIIKKDKNFNLLGFSFFENVSRAKEIINEFKPKYVTMKDSSFKDEFNNFKDVTFFYGERGLLDLVKVEDYATIINSIVGLAGLAPTVEAIKAKKDILLANKETLVCAGDLIKRLVKENKVNLIPIDSEHSAIMQCLKVGKKKEIKKIIITASGGSFRDLSRSELENVTLVDALRHPNWNMGKKITIDSSTMVNKGLEVIEAHYLFDVDYSKIETVIHKESIIHSMVEYKDNGIIAHLAVPDMHLPIMYAMYYPRHLKGFTQELDFSNLNLSFKKMDTKRFPMVEKAYFVGRAGGVLPLVYNTSNEVAVSLFTNGKIKYLDIEDIITKSIDRFKDENIYDYDIDDLLEFDKKVRSIVLEKWS